MKGQKGITLVALVITIIVLLILAGVSISLVLGQNGILNRATGAVSTNEKATAEQEVKMAVANAQVAFYSEHPSGTDADITTYLTNSTYYTGDEANCTGASSVSCSDVNDGAFTVTYTAAKSGTVYTFTVDANHVVTLTSVAS